MKKIQITQELFVKMLKYFYSDELEIDDYELNELYYDIKNGIDKKWTPYQGGVTTPSIKRRIQMRRENRQDKSILMQSVCTKILGGNIHLNYINGNVPHSRKTIKNERIEL